MVFRGPFLNGTSFQWTKYCSCNVSICLVPLPSVGNGSLPVSYFVNAVLFRLHREMHRALSLLPRYKKNGEGKQKLEKTRNWGISLYATLQEPEFRCLKLSNSYTWITTLDAPDFFAMFFAYSLVLPKRVCGMGFLYLTCSLCCTKTSGRAWSAQIACCNRTLEMSCWWQAR